MTVGELAAVLTAAAERAGRQVCARSGAAGFVLAEVEFEVTYVRTRRPPAGTPADDSAVIAVDSATVLAAPEKERERLRFSVFPADRAVTVQ